VSFGEPDEAPLPRADVAEGVGGFTLRDLSPRGLSPAFWFLLLYLFIGLSYVDEEWPRLGALRPRFILGSLLLLTVAVRILGAANRSRKGLQPPDAVTAWWGAYVLATVLATLWAYDFALSKEWMLGARLPALFCFALIVALVRARREFLLVVIVFCLAHGAFLARSFQEFFNGRHLYTMGVVRMVGAGLSNADPNSFAATIVFALPLVLWVGLHARSRLLQAASAAYFLLTGWAVLLTRSRSGVILLGLTVLWLLAALPGRKAKAWGTAIVVALVLAGATQLSESALNRYKGMLTGGSTESERESTHGRIEGYQVAWRIFKEQPITGVGPGNWASYRMRHVDGLTMMPHNLAGLLLATLGLLGTVTFTGYVLATFLRGRRERRARKGLVDPWDRAVRSFAGAMLFTLLLLLISGIAAHNLGRWAWSWAPGLLLAAVTCRPTAPGRRAA
jgi:O-antigen ligase